MTDHDVLAQKYSRILDPMTRAGRPFFVTVTLLARIVFWSFFAFGWQYKHGLGVTGMGHPVSWSFYLINFVFFIGISHAGTLISAILRITHATWRTPVTRAAEVVTFFALAAGPTNILFDLGRSIKFHWVAIHAQFKSPLLWDFTCIMTYFITCVLFLYVLYAVNTKSAFLCAKAVAPAMKARGKGSIVNIGSISGRGTKKERADMAAYGTAKAAVMNLSIHMAQHWGPEIRVNAIAPGIIDTPRPAGSMRQEGWSEALKSIAMGRAGTADEVASVALFLASDAASFVSGAIIDVNGGE